MFAGIKSFLRVPSVSEESFVGISSTNDWESKWTMTKDTKTNYIYFDPKGKHENTIILLHGFSSTSSAFENFIKNGLAPESTRVILPQAPVRWNGWKGGWTTRSWWQMDCIPTIE